METQNIISYRLKITQRNAKFIDEPSRMVNTQMWHGVVLVLEYLALYQQATIYFMIMQ